jgi:hypothetical protein
MAIPGRIRKQILPGLNLVIRLELNADTLSDQLPKKVKRLSTFWKSPEAKNAQALSAQRVEMFWKNNVYRVYNKGSGNLGKACIATPVGPGLVISMGNLYHVHRYQRSGAYGIWEYGHFLRTGTAASPGAYSHWLGVRVRHGTHPGVAQSKYWKPWMNIFRPAARRIYKQAIGTGMKGFIRSVMAGTSGSHGVSGWTSEGMKSQFFVSQANAVKGGGWK